MPITVPLAGSQQSQTATCQQSGLMKVGTDCRLGNPEHLAAWGVTEALVSMDEEWEKESPGTREQRIGHKNVGGLPWHAFSLR
jgi:hypothetical protein